MILSPSRAAFPTKGKIGGRSGGIRTTDANAHVAGDLSRSRKTILHDVTQKIPLNPFGSLTCCHASWDRPPAGVAQRSGHWGG